jgi:hypothetical protein
MGGKSRWINYAAAGQSLVLGLARHASRREARNGALLASEGMEGLLALEVARASK